MASKQNLYLALGFMAITMDHRMQRVWDLLTVAFWEFPARLILFDLQDRGDMLAALLKYKERFYSFSFMTLSVVQYIHRRIR